MSYTDSSELLDELETIREQLRNRFAFVESADDMPKPWGGSGILHIDVNPKLAFHLLEFIFEVAYVDILQEAGFRFIDDKTTWEYFAMSENGFLRIYDWKNYTVSVGSFGISDEGSNEGLEKDAKYLKKLVEENLSKLTAWVADPLDGTHNFKRGFGYSAVSLGYAENGVTVLGAVYDPFRKELYVAEKGKGVTRNGKPIHPSGKQKFESSTRVCTTNSYENRLEISLGRFFKLGHVWVDVLSSAVLMMTDIASGRIDLMFHEGLHPWDNIAGFLIAEEVGLKITDLKGNSTNWLTDSMVMGNPDLVDEFIRLTN